MPPRPRQTPPSDVGLSGKGITGPVAKGPGRKIVLGTSENKPNVIRLLATGVTNRAIAERYEVSPSSVAHFRRNNGEAIAKLRKGIADAAAAQDALWIADRVDRLAVLQDATEQAVELLETATPSQVPELIRTIVAALHEAAEQLGQLPTRMTVQANTVVQYRFVGVDMENL